MSTDAEKKAAAKQRAKNKDAGLESYRREIKKKFFAKMDECLAKLKKGKE